MSKIIWTQKNHFRDTSALTTITPESIRQVKSLSKKNKNERNQFIRIKKTRPLPSPQFLTEKKNSELKQLQSTISLKEIQFRNCPWSCDIEKGMYEIELGELHAQLMKPYK